MKEVVRRIKARIDRDLQMASSSNQAGEFERMMAIVKQMMRSRNNDVSVEKAVERVVEIEGQFNGRNITEFLVLGNMSLRMEPDGRCREPAHHRTGPDRYRPIGRTEM